MRSKHDKRKPVDQSLLLQRLDYVWFSRERIIFGPKALDRNPFAIDQKFRKVPFDETESARLFFLQKLPEWRRVRTVNFDFSIQIKRDTEVIGSKFLDGTIVTGFLIAELIAGKRHYPKTS